MRHYLLKLYIIYRSHTLGKPIPLHYLDILRHYADLKNEYKICFSFLKDGLCKRLNASSAIPGMIIFSYEWAARLVLCQNEVDTVFKVTLGHEIAHQKKWMSPRGYYGNKKRFINWTNEVYADFDSFLEVDGIDRGGIISALKYKKSSKTKDKDTSTHPSWSRRIEYVTRYNFNKELILRIAKDTRCVDEMLIDAVLKFFPVLSLTK